MLDFNPRKLSRGLKMPIVYSRNADFSKSFDNLTSVHYDSTSFLLIF